MTVVCSRCNGLPCCCVHLEEAGVLPVRNALNAADLAALEWCREHNIAIRFESNGTVSARGDFGKVRRRRRKTFVEAVEALRDAMEKP